MMGFAFLHHVKYINQGKDYNSKLMKPILTTVLTLALLRTALAQVSFSVTSATVTPNTARATNAQFNIQLTAISPSSTNFDLTLAFTTAFSINSVSACSVSANGNALTSTVCSASSNTVSITSLGISSVINTLSIGFKSTSALYAGNFVTTLTYYPPGTTSNQYNSTTALLKIENATMTCSLTSTSVVVGATADYTLAYSPSVLISANSILQISFPAWSVYSLTNFPSGTSSSVCGGLCTIRNPNTAQGLTNELLTYSSLYSTDSSSSNSVTMLNARNPASTNAITVSVNIFYSASGTSQPSYMNCSASLAPTTPGTFGSISFSPTNTSISAVNSISLYLALTNPISSISYLQVTYSSDLQLAFSQTFSTQPTTAVTVPTSLASTLLISNLTNSTTRITSIFLGTFTLTNPPYAGLSPSLTFLTQNLVSSTYYSVDKRSVSVTSTTSTIATASVSLSDPSIGITSTLTLTFNIVNSLISGSLVYVTVPSSISLASSTGCSCIISSTCTVSNASVLQLTINAVAVAPGASFSITVQTVTNPLTTTPSASFTINTYYYNVSTPVDSLSSGLTITATAVQLHSATLTSSSLTVAANSSYTLSIQPQNPTPAGSSFTVLFPSDFPNSVNAVLSSLTISSASISTCSMTSISSMKFNISGCFASTIAAQSNIVLVISNIINPYSTKPTASLQVEFYYQGLLMEYKRSGLTAAMSTPASLSFAAITPNDPTANAVTNYLLSLTLPLTHYPGDTILLTFPTSISIPSSPACTTSTSGLTIASCAQSSTSIMKITLGGVVPSSIGVTISNIRNNWYSGSNLFSVKTTTNDSTTYYVEQGTASATITAAALTVSCTPTNSLVLLSTSTLTVTVTSPFPLTPDNPQLLTLTLTLPSVLTGTSTCSASLTGTGCSISSNTYTLSPLTTFSQTMSITFVASAGYFVSAGPFASALKYNGNNVATDETLSISPYCTSPCKGCNLNATQCTSCLPTPYTTLNYLYSVNSSCLSSCPNGYYLPSGSTTCAECNTSACLTCSGTLNFCTSCATSKYLYNGTCLSVCPNTYFGDAGSCVLCQNQCYNCTSATYCISCITNYNLNPDHSCQVGCPSGYLPMSSICQKCTSPCDSCSGTLTTCTSCVAGYILYSSTCVLACPLGKYKNGNNDCVDCISPCKYCTSELICTSCITNYYLYDGTKCVATCPAGTYSLVTQCTNCSTTCQTCFNTATNCTSCNSGLNLYVGACYSECPALTYPYLGVCTTCVSPCATCLNGAYSCSTCESGYLLLNTTCVLSCPSSGYVQLSGSCVACPTHCISCGSSTTCSACESGYYRYSGSCISSCPSTSPIIVDQACTSCAPQCATCSQSPTSCITCTLYYYRYSYTCVESCPVSYFSNQVDYTCESGLSSKIVFFPVLITYIVILFLLIVVKLFAHSTSLPTSLTAFSGWLELIIWIYLLALVFNSYLQPGLTYALPRALLLVSILGSILLNVLHFKANWVRLQEDEYVSKWQDVNINNTYLIVVRYISLCSSHKFFRIIYSKIFHSLHFSMVAFRPKNVFSVSTIFTVTALLTAEIPALVAAFYLAYNKLLKDQIFYTAVETLIVTVTSLLFALIDIYKPTDYFDDTEFMETKRYLEKVNNDSLNKLEDEFRGKDEGSVDGEKQMGLTGGKFVFSKKGQMGSNNELLFEEQQSADTEALEHKKMTRIQVEDIEMEENQIIGNEDSLRSVNSRGSRNRKQPPWPIFFNPTKTQTKINIFEPIQEEEAQYYEVLKYDEEDFKTAAKLEKERIDGNNSELDENELHEERREEFGMSRGTNTIDDNVSLLEERERKEEWNRIIDHRSNLARQIFNTIDTKELFKIEAIDEEEEERFPPPQPPHQQKVFNKRPQRLRKMEEARIELEQQLRRAKLSRQKEKITEEEEDEFVQQQGPTRRRRRRKVHRGNKQLQEIYLQRLAEKVPDPKRKTMYASSKSFKYEF